MVDWASVYTTHAPAIRTYFVKRVYDDNLADDLTADLFVRALEATRRGHGCQRHLNGYLFRAAHNAIVDTYRSREWRLPPADVDDYPHLVDPAQAIEQVVERAEACAYVHWLLRRLTPEQEQAVRLRYLEEMSFGEIGAVMGKSVDAVKALVFRARVSLRGRMGR